MFSIPDVPTLSLCSTLMSFAFMTVYLTLWRARTGQSFLLDWAASSGLYAAIMVGFGIVGDHPVAIAVLHALLGLSSVLVLTGVDRFDGLKPFRPWTIPLILLPSLGYLGPALLLEDRTVAQMGGILGLASVMVAIGSVLSSGRRNGIMGGRRIAGLALLGYVPAYLLTLVVLMNHSEIPHAGALVPLLADQVLLPILNLGLISMPGERAQAVLRRIALRDSLTGALNRAGLTADAPAVVTSETAVIAIDVDHFKTINDRYGHAAGDAVLVALATCTMRRLSGQDLFVRLGGDEFVVVLADTAREAALAFADDLRRSFQTLPDLPAWTASMGVSMVAPGETSLIGAMARADQALYEAKASGRDCAAA
ncbi:GGDEF domain-containing protein [Methylobacterium marchantiae]|uniref:diguanylate cyclase n=1 Tax=Methylobacterium marchantiae TaxID=600331 RepID=A0ABW3WTS0_9HYPH|nr:hypothetical protein AIGOOFII_0359 [Methylobacterium marchantiae]